MDFCFRKTRDRDAAEDLAQESFARALSMLRAGQVILEPRALLRQVAVRAKIDLDRWEALRQAVDIDALDESCQPAIPEHEQPDERYASVQLAESCIAAIERLSPRYRETFCLYLFDELPNAEIARLMGISLARVQHYICTGKDACQTCRAAER